MRKATWAPIAAIILVGAAVAYVLISTQPQGSAPPIEDELRLEPIAEGLVHPVAAAIAPGIDDRVFIVDQIGTVHMLMDDGTLVDEPFIDLRDDIVE
ncbi:MAG TPA: hypothetical protein PKX44_03220, partial [Methanomassiliicoccaceae archaeon]|nr:hypothetical protein [Methanomassiliicoccaceae archaeon]